jgi:sugar lactone lactonase YvrE
VRRRVALFGVAAALLALFAAAAGAAAPPRGVVTVIAHVPSPGYPAFPLVYDGNIYEGSYSNLNGDSIPSHVWEYSGTGTLLKTWIIKGQNLAETHGVQVATVDAAGDLIVMEDQSGVILKLNRSTGAQTVYSTIPDIPTCTDDSNRQPCSQAIQNEPPEPDYAAWGPDGSLYITDYQQAVIWRVPPGGGAPSIWLSSRALDGMIFGTAGLVMMPDHRTLMFDQASNAGLGAGDPTTGKLYTVAIESDGKPGPLHQIWQSNAAAAPDGFALTQSGHIYMALVGPSANDIVELSSTGQLLGTFGTPGTGYDGTSIPFDEPSGVSFLGSELVIANQSYLPGDTAHMALLGLGTGETGASVYVPRDAGGVSTATKKARKRRPKRHRTKKRR